MKIMSTSILARKENAACSSSHRIQTLTEISKNIMMNKLSKSNLFFYGNKRVTSLKPF